MARFREILVATDYSPSSEHALGAAAALAARFGAKLTVLHVIEESAYAYPFPIPTGVRDAAKAHLGQTVARLQARSVGASGVLREGIAWSEICAVAAAASADLVVMGSHGRRGLPRFVLGSVAERVVRSSPAPVLTVRPTDHAAIDRFQHILAPTDFSEASQRGVETAVALALELDAALTIVHVYEPPSYAYYALDEVAVEIEVRVRQELDRLLAGVRVRVPKAEGLVRRGNAWHRILDAAKECGTDMVVLSTHGRHGPQRLLIGSVAEKVVRLSPVAVLTVGTK